MEFPPPLGHLSDSFTKPVASSGKGLCDVTPESLWGSSIVPITAEGPRLNCWEWIAPLSGHFLGRSPWENAVSCFGLSKNRKQNAHTGERVTWGRILGNTPRITAAGFSYLCLHRPWHPGSSAESTTWSGCLIRISGDPSPLRKLIPCNPRGLSQPQWEQGRQFPCWEVSLLSVQLINTAQWRDISSINHNFQRIQSLEKQSLHWCKTCYVLGIYIETLRLNQKWFF